MITEIIDTLTEQIGQTPYIRIRLRKLRHMGSLSAVELCRIQSWERERIGARDCPDHSQGTAAIRRPIRLRPGKSAACLRGRPRRGRRSGLGYIASPKRCKESR